LATPDTRYQHLDTVLFGASSSNGQKTLIDSHYRPAIGNVADRDQAVIIELERQLRHNPKGGHIYILALDSSHFDYVWGSDFTPKFIPYAKTVPVTHDYSHDIVARGLVFNRYKNSVAWVDRLLGRAIDAIESTMRLEQSIIVITGDHGESFWEHETGTHGSNLTRQQLEVGFVMRLPGRTARHSDSVISLTDVMPTVLDELGLDSSELDGKALRNREGSTFGVTFQGWNEQAYHFSLTLPKRRLLFELDHAEPLRSQRLILADVTDLDDVSVTEKETRVTDFSAQHLLRELPQAIDQLSFMEL
jgi:arylsulfatase A-like enzyme